MRALPRTFETLTLHLVWSVWLFFGAPAAASPAAASNHANSPASAGRVAWAALSAPQKQALQPLQKDWSSLSPDRQQKWLEVAARMPIMTDEERERVRERMAEWARMTPAQRGQARLQFQEARQWTSEDRQARWEAYLALSDDERTALAGQAKRSGEAASQPGGRLSAASMGQTKKNTVAAPTHQLASPKTVGPTVVQIRPGATTQLVSKTNSPPAHHQPGLPKIAATGNFVDPLTLLPKRGPQAAAMAASADEQATIP